tara:strand:- start:46 stop:324 length:279 start_codon:yes stop_codon:yes gene_type:complete
LKISPENILCNNNYNFKNIPIYISGNDETYIKGLEDFFLKKFKSSGFGNINYLEKSNNYSPSSSLFGEGFVNIVYSPGFVNKDLIKTIIKAN